MLLARLQKHPAKCTRMSLVIFGSTFYLSILRLLLLSVITSWPKTPGWMVGGLLCLGQRVYVIEEGNWQLVWSREVYVGIRVLTEVPGPFTINQDCKE